MGCRYCKWHGTLDCGGRAKRRRRFGRDALLRIPRDAEVHLPLSIIALPQSSAAALQKGYLVARSVNLL